MSDHDEHEVYAVRYAHHKRKAAENFIFGDPHDVLQPLDYYVWAIRGPLGAAAPGVIVVDTGMTAAAIARRPGRTLPRPRCGCPRV